MVTNPDRILIVIIKIMSHQNVRGRGGTRMDHATLHHAQSMVFQDWPILSNNLVTDIVILCYLIENTCLVPAAAGGPPQPLQMLWRPR